MENGQSRNNSRGGNVLIAIVLIVLAFLLGMVITHSCSKGKDEPEVSDTPPPPPPPPPSPAQFISEAISYDHQVSQEAKAQKAPVDGVNADCDETARIKRIYVSRMRSFLLSNASLPADYRTIHYEHISAHNKCANLLEAHPLLPNNNTEGFLIGMLNGFSGQFDGGAKEINKWVKDVQAANREISETWDAVLQCAIRYGVQINTEE